MEATRPSRAQALFDEIKTAPNGAEFIRGLIERESPAYEGEYLDFKGGQQLKFSDNSFLDLWSKNLSCFANSDGGVVIFGVDAPHGQAKNISLGRDVEDLVKRLKHTVPIATEPPVPRVEIEGSRIPRHQTTVSLCVSYLQVNGDPIK